MGFVPDKKTALRRPLPHLPAPLRAATTTATAGKVAGDGRVAGKVAAAGRVAAAGKVAAGVAIKVAAGVGATGALTFLWANQVELTAFRLKRVVVPALPAGQGPLRILHLSDFHMTRNQLCKQRWIAGLDALEPDLVINTGDNLGGADAVPAVLNALGPLLNRPGAFVFGTNDYFGPRPINPLRYLTGKKRRPSADKLPWEGMRAAFIERGWHDATHRRLEFVAGGVRLAITGVDDPHHHLDEYDTIAGAPNPDADFAIGLSHSPEPHILDRFAEDDYDLVLSGHTHGGQVCLPFERAIVTNCGIDRSRASGLSRWTEKTWLHVSNGLGTSPYAPVRLFCRPSATLIEVVAEDA